jgi:hypothetical protein
LSGRLDQTRDWFATTPVAMLLENGTVIAGRDREAAETPDIALFGPVERKKLTECATLD